MKRYDLENKIFIGIVEDNEDPKKLGRLKIRVVNVFDDIPVEDIPFSKPWKDLNGNSFILPEKGKIVSVVFDGGNPYKPEYIFAEHYNKNLEEKLKSLSGSNYTSMRALMFDHKTQIYSNDDEGLKLDYKFNNINLTESNINLNLKDNQGKIALGDAEADQQIILGTNFMKWFDELVDNLMGSKGGPYFGNLGAPVVAHPQLIEVMTKYKALRDPKFLSDNIYANSNHKISTVSKDKTRKNDNSLGDDIKSTIDTKKKTYDTSGDFAPKVDLNNEANISNDPEDVTPKTKPVYLDENSPQSGIICEFADEMVKISKTQIGIFENPVNSNSGPEVQGLYQRSTWLTGTGWAWCGAFICYLFKEAAKKPGMQYSFTLPKTAGAYDFENWARNNSKYVDVIKGNFNKILPGDIIIFNFSHIGISISQVTDGSITCIEGNTDARGSREGGGVYKKHRKLSLIKAVIRLKYNPNLVVTKTKTK